MNIETIKECFVLFTKCLDKKISYLPTKEEIDEYDIQKIKSIIDILYMKHIVTSICGVSETSMVKCAYNHLTNLINDYRDEEIKNLQQTIEEYRNSICIEKKEEEPKNETKSASWF